MPQTTLEELTVLPQAEAPSWIWGPLHSRGGAGLGKRRVGEGKGRGSGGEEER